MSGILRKPQPRGSLWRVLGWGTAIALLVAPFIAMQLHAEGVNWTLSDFIFAGVILATVGALLELTVRLSPNASYLGGVALALLGSLLVVWSNLAVGIVGSEENPLNQLFFAAVVVGIATATFARFRARGMSWAMIATAISLAVAFVIATSSSSDEPNVSHFVELFGLSAFALLFVASAALFRRAARLQSSSSS